MKQFKLLMSTLLLALFILSCTTGQKETAVVTMNESTTINYVALTQKMTQLKALALTAQDMQAEDKELFGDFHIVFCGKDVGILTDAELITPYVEMIQNAGGKLFACGFSLTQFEVDQSALAEGIEVIENGLTYSLQMKKNGAYSIDQ